jgi:hypothetical protein
VQGIIGNLYLAQVNENSMGCSLNPTKKNGRMLGTHFDVRL